MTQFHSREHNANGTWAGAKGVRYSLVCSSISRHTPVACLSACLPACLGMSFAFSLKASTRRKPILSASGSSSSSAASALLGGPLLGDDEEDVRIEAVKSIGAGGVIEVTDGERALAAAKKLVIPLIVPPDDVINNEQRNQDVALADTTMVPVGEGNKHDVGSAAPSKRPNRLLLAKVDPTMDDAKRFKSDVMKSAEDISTHSDAYRAVPVEEFGAALLRGMGWRDEAEAGEKGQSSFFDAPIVPREKGLGLGAKPRPQSIDQGPAKKLTNPRHYAAAKAAASSSKQLQQASEWQQKAEQKVKEQVLRVGDHVWLRLPSLAGRRGRIVEVADAPFVQVCLDGADAEQVRVRREEVVMLSSEELTAASSSHASVTSSEVALKTEPVGDYSIKVKIEDEDEGDLGWFYAGIRVRITTKKLDSSECAAYLQKGSVLSVGSDGRASIRLDSGHVLQGVSCRRAETLLPQTGAPCLIVSGPFRGTRGSLLLRDKQRGLLDLQPAGGAAAIRGLTLDAVAALQG